MRLVIALLLSGCTFASFACSCFSPELRAKTARETLELARLAVIARVVAVDAAGAANLLVLESFKGPPKEAALTAVPDAQHCPQAQAKVGEEVLVLSFADGVTLCDKHPMEHFLVQAFRANAAK